MTKDEFLDALKTLDAGYPPAHDPDNRKSGIWNIVREFEAEVMAEACSRLAKEIPYLPTGHDVYEACAQVDKERRRDEIPPVKVHRPPVHRCSEAKPAQTEALSLLAVMWPYEAEHVCCGTEIRATCAQCGARHNPHPNPIDFYIETYPDQTVGWNSNWKGGMKCPRCAKMEEKVTA